jgi:hypothetical protein
VAENVFADAERGALDRLLALRTLVGTLASETRDFISQPAAADLWASVLEEIQQCSTPEAARETRRRIYREMKTHDVNLEVQRLAGDVTSAMERQLDELEQLRPLLQQSTYPRRKLTTFLKSTTRTCVQI